MGSQGDDPFYYLTDEIRESYQNSIIKLYAYQWIDLMYELEFIGLTAVEFTVHTPSQYLGVVMQVTKDHDHVVGYIDRIKAKEGLLYRATYDSAKVERS